jgi:hypothetical protein
VTHEEDEEPTDESVQGCSLRFWRVPALGEGEKLLLKGLRKTAQIRKIGKIIARK